MFPANPATSKTGTTNISSCSTEFKFSTAILRWKIDDYNFLRKTAGTIESPEFPEDKDKSRKWVIDIGFHALVSVNRFQAFTVKRTYSSLCRTRVEVSICLEKNSGEFSKLNEYGGLFPDDSDPKICIEERVHTILNDLHWNESVDKSLTIICKIRILDSTETVWSKITPKSFKSNDLSQDISTFFSTDKNFLDVTIFVGKKTFKAHKLILAARSPVFAAMFTHEMSEKRNNSFEIKDCKPETVEKMLRFIYSDKLDDSDLKESVDELFAAADKYNLERLKEICIAYMQDNLKIENVSRILYVADVYSIFDVKIAALKFVVSHRQEVKNLDVFKELIVKRPHLIMEIFDIPNN